MPSLPNRQGWRQRLPFYYGWVVVGGAFVSLGLTYTVWYSFSVFYVALLQEFGWSRAASAGVFSLFVIMVGVAGIFAGALADRLGPSRIAATGATILAIGLMACSRMTELWQFYLLFGVVCAAGVSSSGWISAVTAVNRWFSARLGTALGVTSAGIGMGILIMVPVSQILISNLGWRNAYLVLAAVIFFGVVPISLLALRGRPEDLGLQRDGRKSPASRAAPVTRRSRVVDKEWANREWTVQSAIRTRRYWLVFATFSLGNVASQMIFVHQVAFLVDGGYDKLLAASIVGLVGLFSVGAKISWGSISDRIGREPTYTAGSAFLLLAIGLLILTRVVVFPPLIYVFAFAFALGYGVTPPLGPAVGADIWAGRRFGSIYGSLSFANGLGSATGAWSAGYVFDATGSYLLAFGCAAVTSILSAAALWLAAPRKIRRAPGRS